MSGFKVGDIVEYVTTPGVFWKITWGPERAYKQGHAYVRVAYWGKTPNASIAADMLEHFKKEGVNEGNAIYMDDLIRPNAMEVLAVASQ